MSYYKSLIRNRQLMIVFPYDNANETSFFEGSQAQRFRKNNYLFCNPAWIFV